MKRKGTVSESSGEKTDDWLREAGLLDPNTTQRGKRLLRMLKRTAGVKFCHDSAQLLQVCKHTKMQKW